MLAAVHFWTIRFLVPRRFRKAVALYRWAVRDYLRPPLSESVGKRFAWYLRAKHGRDLRYVEAPRDLTLQQATRKFSGAHFQTLEWAWLQDECKSPTSAWSKSVGSFTSWRRAARRANVKPGIHILRHTFCSHLAMRGAPARAIQELAGYQDLKTTQRYVP